LPNGETCLAWVYEYAARPNAPLIESGDWLLSPD
jgi:gamma-glutamylcyclotransferase (GGCT)/AIG2-like uncharacterized protein YtfP